MLPCRVKKNAYPTEGTFQTVEMSGFRVKILIGRVKEVILIGI